MNEFLVPHYRRLLIPVNCINDTDLLTITLLPLNNPETKCNTTMVLVLLVTCGQHNKLKKHRCISLIILLLLIYLNRKIIRSRLKFLNAISHKRECKYSA